MARPLSIYHSFFQRGPRLLGKVWRQARSSEIVAILSLMTMTLGIVCLVKLSGAFGTSALAQGGGGSNPTYTFTAIDVPGAGTGMLQGTIGTSLNVGGDITGVYLTAPNVAHGFVRIAATGMIAKFDAPDAGTSL